MHRVVAVHQSEASMLPEEVCVLQKKCEPRVPEQTVFSRVDVAESGIVSCGCMHLTSFSILGHPRNLHPDRMDLHL